MLSVNNRNQYVPINVYESDLVAIIWGAPQGFVVGTFLFLLYVNDLNQAVELHIFTTLMMTLIYYV